MTTVSRHAGAPFANGETLSGTDLETDISGIVTVVNGNIDDSNIASGANIAGSKINDGTVTTAKLAADGVTLAKMAAASVPKGYVTTATATTNMTTSASFVPIDGINTSTIAVGNVGDYIFLDFSGAFASGGTYSFGFRVDGVDSETLQSVVTSGDVRTHYAAVATATGTVVVAPVYKKTLGPAGQFLAIQRVFRTLVVPTKP